MSRGYWLSLIAIVGWLGFAGFALAQTPENKGVPDKAPAVETQPTNNPKTAKPITQSFPLKVQIIESQVDAEHTQAREQKSDQHDAEDLDAQVRAANAAERQIWFTKANIFLTFAGTLLILWTLWETRKANANTLGAIAQEQANAQRQLRAYLYISQIALGYSEPSKLQIQMVYKNFGQTPAKSVRLQHIAGIGPVIEDKMTFGGLNEQNFLNSSDIPPGHEIAINYSFDTLISDEILNRITDKKLAIYFWGTADYADAFGKPQRLIFRRVVRRLPAKTSVSEIVNAGNNVCPHFEICDEGNEST